LERKNQPDETPRVGSTMLTPPITEDYWEYRVVVGEGQAIVGFPKFFTIGIGFAVEEDWNTNLPYTSDADDIWNHIKHNKGDRSITKADCLAAIRMVQEAATADRAEESK
jgi:hypothetical protein